jgi:hypothetical protein
VTELIEKSVNGNGFSIHQLSVSPVESVDGLYAILGDATDSIINGVLNSVLSAIGISGCEEYDTRFGLEYGMRQIYLFVPNELGPVLRRLKDRPKLELDEN